MNVPRREDIEKRMIDLGWGKPEGDPQVMCFVEYRPNKKINPHMPWEITMYHKKPVWRWDFVTKWSEWVEANDASNWRSDFEFESLDDLDAVVKQMDEELIDLFDNDTFDRASGWDIAVQRVTDRPDCDTLA